MWKRSVFFSLRLHFYNPDISLFEKKYDFDFNYFFKAGSYTFLYFFFVVSYGFFDRGTVAVWPQPKNPNVVSMV